MQRKKRAILAVLSVIDAGINMLGGLIIKAENVWFVCKRLKAMTHVLKSLYKDDNFSTMDLSYWKAQQQYWWMLLEKTYRY